MPELTYTSKHFITKIEKLHPALLFCEVEQHILSTAIAVIDDKIIVTKEFLKPDAIILMESRIEME